MEDKLIYRKIQWINGEIVIKQITKEEFNKKLLSQKNIK